MKHSAGTSTTHLPSSSHQPSIRVLEPTDPSYNSDQSVFGPNFDLRPITRIWLHRYTSALLAGTSKGSLQREHWFNVRLIGQPSSDGESLMENFTRMKDALEKHQILIDDLLELPLGWTPGECLIKLKDPSAMHALKLLSLSYLNGFYMGNFSGVPDVKFIIKSIGKLETVDHTFSVLMDIEGLPFVLAPLDQGRYILESILAHQKELGILKVEVKFTHRMGETRLRRTRCLVNINSSSLHLWDFQHPMKLTVQAWDYEGRPRPELWSVTLRLVDGCRYCGVNQHLSSEGDRPIECDVTRALREIGFRRARHYIRKQYEVQVPNHQKDNPNPFRYRRPGIETSDKTSIGFTVLSTS